LISVLGGSGDAATLAFNQSVTPHAEAFHMTIARLGSVAQIAGVVGRTMSPVSGACFAAALIAKANPFDVAKRTAPAMMIGTLVILFMLF
jgi:DcuC family C4-dicarboxylate transporter